MTETNARRQVLRLSMFMAPASVIGMILSIPVGIFTSSVLGPALSGVMRIVDIIQKYFGYNHMGLLQGMGREVPIELSKGHEAEARQIVRETFSGNAITTGISLLILWGLYFAGVNFNGVLELWLLIAISLLLISDRFNSLLHTYAKSYGHFDLIARRELFLKLFTPVITVILVALFKLQGAVLALLLSSLISALLYFFGIKDLSLRFQVTLQRLIRVGGIGFLVFANNYAGSLLETVGLIILAQKLTVTEVGLVGFAYRPIGIATGLVTSFNIFFSRHMLMNRGEETHNKPAFYQRFQKYMGGTLISYLLVLVILQGITYLSFTVLTRLFLPQFYDSLPILNIFLFMGMMYGVFTYLQSYMNATDQLKQRLLYLLPVLALNIGLVYFLLDRGVGMASAAWAAMISYSVFSIFVLGLSIYQTSNSLKLAVSFLLRTSVSMGLLTILAIYLDQLNLTHYAAYGNMTQKIGFAILELLPKLVVYLVSASAVFLVLFSGFGLWLELKNLMALVSTMILEKWRHFKGKYAE